MTKTFHKPDVCCNPDCLNDTAFSRKTERKSLSGFMITCTAILVISLLFFKYSQAENFSENSLSVVQEKENRFRCIFEGIKHNFLLYLPAESAGAPLVIMLPGYGNTAESFQSTIHFEQEANALGYAVVYVTGARNPNDPLSSIGWNSGIGSDGNDDAAFLVSLVKYLQKEYSFDRQRTFAAGFSNGAFMIHRLAMEATNTFSAYVSVAGMMPAKIWNERREKSNVSFFQITGEKDDVIPKRSDGSAEYSKNPAIEDVMTYWTGSNGLSLCESEIQGNGSLLTKCRSEASPNQVWHLLVKNGRHSWPEEKIIGIDANSLILEFFENISPVRTDEQANHYTNH